MPSCPIFSAPAANSVYQKLVTHAKIWGLDLWLNGNSQAMWGAPQVMFVGIYNPYIYYSYVPHLSTLAMFNSTNSRVPLFISQLMPQLRLPRIWVVQLGFSTGLCGGSTMISYMISSHKLSSMCGHWYFLHIPLNWKGCIITPKTFRNGLWILHKAEPWPCWISSRPSEFSGATHSEVITIVYGHTLSNVGNALHYMQ